jgi:hypothetical protein
VKVVSHCYDLLPYSSTHKGSKEKPKLVARLGEAPSPARSGSPTSPPLSLLRRPNPAGRPPGPGASPLLKVTGPRGPPPSETRSPPSPAPRRRRGARRALPPFVRPAWRGIPGTVASPACGRASCSCRWPRGWRCRWGRSSRRARAAGGGRGRGRGAGQPGGAGEGGRGQGGGRSGNSLSPRGGGRRGLQARGGLGRCSTSALA